MDNKHATFLLSRWGASAEVQLRHWQKFDSFAPLLPELRRRRGKYGPLTHLGVGRCAF